MNKNKKISRREYIAKGALLGTGAFLLNPPLAFSWEQGKIMNNSKPDADYQLNNPENIIHSVCLNCNTGCGIKCKIQDGVLVKIDGNPYNPWTLVPHLPMSANLSDAAKVDGGLCPKGQAGVQIAYDPYRIRKVLKRAGKRGENKWISVPFRQAISEIVEGGKLFAHVPAEENRHVEGLRSIMTLKDNKLAKDMSKDIQVYWKEEDKNRKEELLQIFKTKFHEHLDLMIDPNHPDMGPKNNQFVMAWGRLKNGRNEFISRLGQALGTVNMHGHTTVCQGSLYFTCKAISEQYTEGKFSGGSKFYWQTDIEHARYILFVGANLFDANYGPTNRTVRLTKNLEKGYTKIAVADPRFSKLASKAETWLPVKPGDDAALAMAVIRWMFEHQRFDKTFLANANKAAAKFTGEPSFTNASLLVEINGGQPGQLVRAADIGIAAPHKRKNAGAEEYTEKFLVTMVNGKPVKIDPNDDKNPVYGDLFTNTQITIGNSKKITVKSGLQLLKDEAYFNSFDDWCTLAGLKPDDVAKVAKELTSYGKQASVDIHRGVAQHTNGFYNVFAWMSVNMLLGNYDWQGGMSKATTYKFDGSNGGKYDLKINPGKIQSFGISSIRHGSAYEETSLFEGYPAKRNWFPLSSDIYEEIIPSIGDAYPYPVKALFMYMGAPTYALPAGHTNIEVLTDVEKLPLFFCSDILIGPTSMYADYVFPDLTYLERWEFQGSHPNMIVKVENVRQPVIPPIPETVKVNGEEMPISMESTLMAINEEMGLKAFGKDALGEGLHINRAEDLYLRAVANLALEKSDGGPVPDATPGEIEIFSRARRHLPATVFNESYWRKVTGEDLWAKTVYILNRGGRFAASKDNPDGKLTNKYGALLNLYQEKTAGYTYSGTGEKYKGVAQYIPQKNYGGETLEKLSAGYDLHLITSRTITQTKSRTIAAYWLHGIMPGNSIIISRTDAERLGFNNGDKARIVSATNTKGEWDLKNGEIKEIIGEIKITEAIRPGVINFYLGFGHWATGSSDIEVNGEIVRGDPRRAKGFHANAVMWTDSSLRYNTCLIDPVGGSVSFYDTRVRLDKV